MRSEVIVTIQSIGETQQHTSARVISFTTGMSPKEVLAAIQVMATLLKHYKGKEQ